MFKRDDSDDLSQLTILKKRRVDELLAHQVPEDEALLMSSGRYACTVCHYRPVFDTLQMLTIHRQGKKHEKCLESHYRKKWTYMALVEKRQQENYVRNKLQSRSDQHQEDPSPLLTKTHEKTQNVLLKATPYNSCVKWSRHAKLPSNVGQRTVPSTDSFLASSQNEHVKSKTIAEDDDHLATPKLEKMSLLERQLPSVEQSRAFKHYMPSKVSRGRIDSDTPMELKPYTSKLKRNTCLDSLKRNTTSNTDVCVPVTEFETSNSYQQGLYPSIIPNGSKMPGFNDSKMPGLNLQLPIRTDFKNSNASERQSVFIFNDSESKGDLNSAIVHNLDHKSASKKPVVTTITGVKDGGKKKKIQQIVQLTRYACTVCHYRPVFDTLQMLTIHRQGKKHEKCLESHYRKKWTYMALVEKRQQENYVRNKLQSRSDQHQEDPSPLLTKTHEKTQNVLLKATPYNSCVKWSRHAKLPSNVGQRTVPSTDSFLASSQNEHVKSKTIAEDDDHLATPKLEKMSLLERQLPSVEQSRAFKHYMPSKVSRGRIDSDTPMELKPYTSKLKRNTCLDSLKRNTTSNTDVCVPVTEFETSNSYQQGLYPSIIPNGSKMPGFNDSKMPGLNLQLPIRTDFKNSNASERQSVFIFNDSESKGDLNSAIVHNLDHKSASKKPVVTTITGVKDGGKKKKIQQIVQLTSSGWKRDRGGIWIKDEDVEFDSDEEEPQLTL